MAPHRGHALAPAARTALPYLLLGELPSTEGPGTHSTVLCFGVQPWPKQSTHLPPSSLSVRTRAEYTAKQLAAPRAGQK